MVSIIGLMDLLDHGSTMGSRLGGYMDDCIGVMVRVVIMVVGIFMGNRLSD